MPSIIERLIERIRNDPAMRRKSFLSTLGVVVVAVVLTAVILTVVALNSRASLADRLAEAGGVVAGATLLPAAIAAVVALVAYAVSSGAPDIQFKIHFPFSEPNNPSFAAERDGDRVKAK